MEKKLPHMYQNKIEKNIMNTQTVFSTLDRDFKEEIKRTSPIKERFFTVEQKIYNIFNSNDYIYKADVTIITDKDTLKKRIVGKNRNNLITMDGEYIPISIIKDIYK